MATASSFPSMASRIDNILQLHNPAKDKATCVGNAPSQKRRCWNPIAASNQSLAKGIADRLPQQLDNHAELWMSLRQLAQLALCQRNHQNQATHTAENWFRTIIQETRAQYGPFSPPPSQTTYTLQFEQTYVLTAEVSTRLPSTSTTVYQCNTQLTTQHQFVQTNNYTPQARSGAYARQASHSTQAQQVLVPIEQRTLLPPRRRLALPSPPRLAMQPQSTEPIGNASRPQAVSIETLPQTPTVVHIPLPAPSLPSTPRVTGVSTPTSPTVETTTHSTQPLPPRIDNAIETPASSPHSSPAIQHNHSHDSTNDTATEEGEETCYICYLPYSEPVQTPCGHKFCRECISEWLVRNRTCPYDRRLLQPSQLVAVETTCAICFEEFSTPCRTPCGHIFCRECITSWLRVGSRRTCPMDRRRLREADLVDMNDS